MRTVADRERDQQRRVVANAVGAPCDAGYPYVWRVRKWLPWLYGQPCRVVVRGRTMNSALIEFACGYRVVASRNFIRNAPQTGREA